MNILVINCGSTTIKYQLMDMKEDIIIAKGRCDMIGYETSNIRYKNLETNYSHEIPVSMPTHKEGMEVIISELTNKEYGVIENLDGITAVGHRVAHGGDIFKEATLVDEKVKEEIRELGKIAPLHNPPALMGIEAIEKVAPNLKNVIVCDTAFHQTIPDYNYTYAINPKYQEKYKIRRYGFHGTSYKYVVDRLATLMNKPLEEINAVICHIGGGASVCAIKNGMSYDTSMGFTPLEGMVMETRCGDIDAAAVTKIMAEENLSPKEMEMILNKESGRVGLCGIGDQRELCDAIDAGNERALLTEKIQANKTKKIIGSYMAELNRVDAIVFTGGIGENDDYNRSMILADMDLLGIKIDEEINKGMRLGKEGTISIPGTKIPVYVIPTDEELEIAIQTMEAVS